MGSKHRASGNQSEARSNGIEEIAGLEARDSETALPCHGNPDYASRHIVRLRQAQAIGANAIIGAFRTLSLPIAEAKAQVEPIELRQQEQRRRFWISSHTLPACCEAVMIPPSSPTN